MYYKLLNKECESKYETLGYNSQSLHELVSCIAEYYWEYIEDEYKYENKIRFTLKDYLDIIIIDFQLEIDSSKTKYSEIGIYFLKMIENYNRYF